MRANPVLAADLQSLGSHPPLLRGLLALVAGPSLLIVAWWPRGPLAANVLSSSPPQVFVAAALGLLALAAYLNFRYGTEDWAPSTATDLRDLAALSPIPIRAALAGRAGSAVIHVAFQALLALPLLLAGRAVSGVAPSAVALALAVVAAWSLACRAFGVLVRGMVPGHGVLRGVLAAVALAAFLVLTFLFDPALNPISAVVAVDSLAPGGSAIAACGPAALAGLAAAGACTFGTWAVLHRVRASARTADGSSRALPG